MEIDDCDKENVDPETFRHRRYKVLKEMVNKNTKLCKKVTKVPKMTLSGKMAEELDFEDESVNKFCL